jgi:predicted secreted protein
VLFLAGLHLLWQAREEFLFWLEEYFRLLRVSVRGMADPQHAPLEMVPRAPMKKHTLRMVIGMLLAFIAAPVLFTVGITMVWLSRRGG